jgi:hypothetical protein
MTGAEDVDPAAVADQVREILARPEFDYGPSWWERITTWIGERLDDLFGGLQFGGGTFAGGAPAFVAWSLVVLAVVGAVAAVVEAVRNRVRPPAAAEGPEATVVLDRARRSDDWAADAERHERAGDWKLALRARLRELVAALVERGQLPDVVGLTTGELRAELDRTTPAASVDFATCCELFELAWYARHPVDEARLRRFRGAAASVLAAPVPTGRTPDRPAVVR